MDEDIRNRETNWLTVIPSVFDEKSWITLVHQQHSFKSQIILIQIDFFGGVILAFGEKGWLLEFLHMRTEVTCWVGITKLCANVC